MPVSVLPLVHPRAGGERVLPAGTDILNSGSSPRGRGTRSTSSTASANARFIPARAGNASGGRSRSARPSVHPRAGGERERCGLSSADVHGSSPRGRGTRQRTRRRRLPVRFIPARAGNATSRRPRGRAASVHPRAGGERSTIDSTFFRSIGSSPRGRGTPRLLVHEQVEHRFIPARAGNAAGRRRSCRRRPVHPARAGNAARACAHRSSSTVHPRAGGERRGHREGRLMSDGSSPRGRGTRAQRHPERPRARFIPARAGNATSPIASCAVTSVHPRAGGERMAGRSFGRSSHGSSPRGRGTQEVVSRDHRGASVHPRAGGERILAVAGGKAFVGSSPRGRGTRREAPRRVERGRFIPARAGNAAAACRSSSRRPVHPRAGGERCRSSSISGVTIGSSPRGRGTRTRRTVPERA